MMVTVSASAAANLMPRSGLIGNIVSNRKLLESSSNGLSGRIPPLSLQRAPVRQGRKVVSCQSALARERVPDMSKRVTMNLLLVGALSLPTAGLVGPYARFFVPAHSPSSMGGSLIARDEIGNEVLVTDWVKTYLAGSKSLVQGLKGDPTYLTVKEDLSLLDFGINAICTHMGCVVQWEGAENKFVCHCHGSQYDAQGKVIRGPAPLSLALAHADNVDDKVVLSPWTEKDFRTDQSPWWT